METGSQKRFDSTVRNPSRLAFLPPDTQAVERVLVPPSGGEVWAGVGVGVGEVVHGWVGVNGYVNDNRNQI